VLKDWQRFIESDFNKARFTKPLYNHLIQHCSFIAHYNQGGFYGTYFEDPEDTMRFIKQFDKEHGCISVEYGMTYWLNNDDYRDINTAMVEVMEPYKGALYLRMKRKAKDIKLKQLDKLKAEIEGLD
jgi:hypothetical protein